MPSFDHTFGDFPEGTWWVAWIDHVLSTATRQRLVHVTLCRLSPGVGSATALRSAASETIVVPMDVSGLPLFAMGDVVHNKRLVQLGDTTAVRSVCDLAPGGCTETFAFDVGSIAHRSGCRLADERAERPPGYPDHLPCPVLSSAEYRFPATGNCLCLVVTERDRTFLLPAAELLRSLVMPFSEALGKLFGGSLAAVVADMVEQPIEPSSLPGHFRMDLKEGYDGRHAPYVANLLAPYNLPGSQAAASIHASLVKADPQLRFQKTIPEGASVLPCVLPFGTGTTGTVTITAKCFALGRRRFLVAKIVGGAWPPSVPLDVGLIRHVVDPDADPPGGGNGRRGGRRTDLRGGDPVDVDLRGTPGYGTEPIEIAVEPPAWRNLPVVVSQVRPRRSAGSTPNPGPSGMRRSNSVAVGQPQPGGNLAPATATRAALPSVDRFDEIWAMLARLKAAGGIVGFDPFLPRDGRRGASRGELHVWIWPQRTSWFILKPSSRPAQPRSILVVRIEVKSGRFVHWFTVEPTATKSYAALLIVFGGGDQHDDVVRMVDEIGERNGAVSDPHGFAQANGGLRGAGFNHTKALPPQAKRSASPSGQTSSNATTNPSSATAGSKSKPLNDRRALKLLHSLCP